MPLLLIILLFTPIADIILAISWLFQSPLSALLYLAASTIIGLGLLKFAKIGAGEAIKILTARDGKQLDSRAAGILIKMWLAGALFLFPGYISDCFAVLLAFLPAPSFAGFHAASHSWQSKSEETPLETEAEVVFDSSESPEIADKIGDHKSKNDAENDVDKKQHDK